MKMVAFILLSLLAMWWLFCTFCAISSHRARRALPTGREQSEEHQILAVSSRRDMRPIARMIHSVIGVVLLLCFMLIMLPFYVHGWFVGYPYKKHGPVT